MSRFARGNVVERQSTEPLDMHDTEIVVGAFYTYNDDEEIYHGVQISKPDVGGDLYHGVDRLVKRLVSLSDGNRWDDSDKVAYDFVIISEGEVLTITVGRADAKKRSDDS
jgi:hypothetical protein